MVIEEQAMSGRPEPARDAVDDRRRGYVTISVDDGHPSDIKTADLLRQFGFRATFYVPATNHDQPILTKSQLRLLAEDFEVGSHTFSHVALPTLPLDRARQEIADGKRWLEDVLGAPVRSFCYPLGRFNRRIVRLVAEAGFDGARTTMNHIVDWPADPFTCATTTQAFSTAEPSPFATPPASAIGEDWLTTAGSSTPRYRGLSISTSRLATSPGTEASCICGCTAGNSTRLGSGINWFVPFGKCATTID